MWLAFLVPCLDLRQLWWYVTFVLDLFEDGIFCLFVYCCFLTCKLRKVSNDVCIANHMIFMQSQTCFSKENHRPAMKIWMGKKMLNDSLSYPARLLWKPSKFCMFNRRQFTHLATSVVLLHCLSKAFRCGHHQHLFFIPPEKQRQNVSLRSFLFEKEKNQP